MAFDFDLFVIGGGSGGVRAARVAAQSARRALSLRPRTTRRTHRVRSIR